MRFHDIQYTIVTTNDWTYKEVFVFESASFGIHHAQSFV